MVLGSCACCAGMLPFWVILCGICVALALWVGALYSDDRLNTKLSEYAGLQNSGVLSDNHAEAPKHNSQAWGSPGLPKSSLDPVHPWKVSVCTEPLVQDRSNPIGTGHSPSMSRLVVSVQPFAAWGILRSTQDRSRLKADQYRKSPRISAREPFGCLRERAVR